MSLYLIAIGGTGAKLVEAVAHIAAAGLLTKEPIRVLFIDPDESNGNLNRARQTLSLYRDCYSFLMKSTRGNSENCAWMKTPIETFRPDIWSPLGSEMSQTLGDLFNYQHYQQEDPLKNLFDVLYTEKERKASLGMGFRGRLAIGAAVMSQLRYDDLEQEPWATFFNQITSNIGVGHDTRIFLCGSTFGGTGASGFPTLGQFIANKIIALGLRRHVKIGGVLLLPYFAITPNLDHSATVNSASAHFLLNTQALLYYYRTQTQQTFDTIYLLGDSSPSSIGNSSIGRGEQHNKSHFVELYAALAVRHFLSHSPASLGEVALISRSSANSITWSDFPTNEIKQQLVNTSRFAFAWTTDLVASLIHAQQSTPREVSQIAPWLMNFFFHADEQKDSSFFMQEVKHIPIITAWCESYLSWLSNLHASAGHEVQVQLFNQDALIDRQSGWLNQDPDNFSRLVMSSEMNWDEKDTTSRLRSELINFSFETDQAPDRSMAGLAKAFYALCRQQ